MLTRIVQPSPALETFLDSLHLGCPNRNTSISCTSCDGVLVCDERKTLAALQRQFLDTTDPSNWADFLRISPWSADGVRDALRAVSKSTGCWPRPTARGLPKVLYINLDDSLGKKDKHTHSSSRSIGSTITTNPRPQPRYHKAFCYLECTARVGDLTATLDLRLYLRAKTVRRLNRHRRPGARFLSQQDPLARDISGGAEAAPCRRAGPSTSSSTVGMPRSGC